MSDWRLIKTAPRTGEHILIYSPDRCEFCPPLTRGQAVVHWSNERWIMGRLIGGGVAVFSHEPTHWKPLSDDPEPSEEGRP